MDNLNIKVLDHLGIVAGIIDEMGLVEIINEIPLIKPTFETVGLGYSAWFIYRYLLKADNRKEISADFNTLKEEILGKKS